MAKDDVTFNFGAEIAPLLAAMERSQEKVREATSTMSKSIESIGGALSKIQGAFMAFTAIATGGAAMRKIITDAGDWNIEALKLSKALGISTEKASEYQIALHRLGISNDTMITASTKMSKQIYNNHDAFVRLGVATKDTSGNFRPMAEVMDDVNAKLIAIKNPLEQNIAGNQVYGKGWAELRPLLKLTADEMAHAKEEGERLGLIVGPKGAEMAKTYKKSLADLDLAGKSLTVQMGQALLPAMTQVTSAFASAAPMIGEVFGSALILVAKVAINLGAGIAALGTHIGGLLAAAAAALSGNFAGAREVLKSMNDDVAAIDKKADDMIAKLDHPIKAGTSEGPDLSSSHLFDDENGGKSRAGEWAQQLAEAKAAYEAQSAAQGQFIEYSKEQERAFWQTKLGLTVAGTKEAGEIRSKVAEATTAIEKKNFEAQLGELKAQEAAFKANTDKRLAIEEALAEKLKKAYGENSNQYKEAKKAIVATEAQAAADILAIQRGLAEAERTLSLAALSEREAQLQFEVEFGVKTRAQVLAAEKEFENERYAIKRAALIKDLELEANNPDRDLKKIQAINTQILNLETQHDAKLSDIRRKSVLESTKNYRDFVAGVQSGFQSVIAGFLKGTMTLSQTIKGLFSAVLDSIVNVLAKVAAEWIAKKLLMLAVDKTVGASTIATSVAEAGAAGVASWAGAPWPIDMFAPAFGASMATAAGAFAIAGAASGGYDIPAGVNPVIQTHAREMILPAALADPLRASLAGGGGVGGGGAVHVHINTTSPQDFARYLKTNSHTLAPALRQMARNFTPVLK